MAALRGFLHMDTIGKNKKSTKLKQGLRAVPTGDLSRHSVNAHFCAIAEGALFPATYCRNQSNYRFGIWQRRFSLRIQKKFFRN